MIKKKRAKTKTRKKVAHSKIKKELRPEAGRPTIETISKQLGQIQAADYGVINKEGAMGVSMMLGSNKDQWEVAATKPAEEIQNLLKQAKRSGVSQMVGVPVEVVSAGNKMKSWRILEEVL